jgi:hypothetical protein
MRSDRRFLGTLILGLLVSAALANGVSVPFGRLNVRPEHITGPILFVMFVALQRLKGEPALRLDGFAVLALGWVLVNAISSWLYAPQWTESRVHVVRMSFLAATFLTVANLPRQPYSWTNRVTLWLGLRIASVAWGVFEWFAARFMGIWLRGVGIEDAIAGISVFGLQIERNLYGIHAATLLAVAFYLLMARRTDSQLGWASSSRLAAACALSGFALVLSLTRSAWLAVVVAAPLTYLIFDRRPLSRGDRPLLHSVVGLPLVLVALGGLLWMLPSPSAATLATGAVSGTAVDKAKATRVYRPGEPLSPVVRRPADGTLISDTENEVVPGIWDRMRSLRQADFTTLTRVQDAKWAVDDWLASPILGRGTGSFGQIHGIRKGTQAWLSNLVLHTMVDTGLVGLAIQISLLVLVAVRAWAAARRTTDLSLATGLRAMTLGLVVVVIAYQLTDGTWMALFWIHLGLMVNGVYCVREEQRRMMANANGLVPAVGLR